MSLMLMMVTIMMMIIMLMIIMLRLLIGNVFCHFVVMHDLDWLNISFGDNRIGVERNERVRMCICLIQLILAHVKPVISRCVKYFSAVFYMTRPDFTMF